MLQIEDILIPEFIIVEYKDEERNEYVAESLKQANEKYDKMLDARPTDDNIHYRLFLVDVDKGVRIREYDSITDNC